MSKLAVSPQGNTFSNKSNLNWMRLKHLFYGQEDLLLVNCRTYLCSRGEENPRRQYPLKWQDRTRWCDPPARSQSCSCSGFCLRCWTWTPAGGHSEAVQDYHKCNWAELKREGGRRPRKELVCLMSLALRHISTHKRRKKTEKDRKILLIKNDRWSCSLWGPLLIQCIPLAWYTRLPK